MPWSAPQGTEAPGHFSRRGFQGESALKARRSEEHTSELQSPCNLVCRLLLEKKKHLRLSLAHSSISFSLRPVFLLVYSRYLSERTISSILPCSTMRHSLRLVAWFPTPFAVFN